MAAISASRGELNARRTRLPLVLSAFVALLVSLLFWAALGRAGIVLAHTSGTSMEPLLHQGDAVIIRAIDLDRLQPHDIILYDRNDRPILHRVVARTVDRDGRPALITKGDNLPEPDALVTLDEVRGRMVARVPLLGPVSRAIGGTGRYEMVLFAAPVVLVAGVLLAAGRLIPSRRAEPSTD